MIVTFMYKINGQRYYGKYIGYVIDNYLEGLDREMAYKLENIFEKYYSTKKEDVVVGVLGFNRDTYDYFSEIEANIFDILYCDWSNQEKEIYVNGKLVKDNIINQ